MGQFIFKGTPSLETARLILSRIIPDDEHDIFEYASDVNVTEYMSWETHQSLEDTRKFIDFTLERYERDEAGEWGIHLKDNGKLIGALGFPWCDMKNRRAEIGYVLSRKYWGQGFMPEAVGRVLKFAFTEMGLNRIECCHFLPNEKSGRVMQKVGMRFEGSAKERIFAKGQFWDVKQYAILRADWEKQLTKEQLI